MVEPVKNLSAMASTFGGEIDVIFELPTTLPEKWKLYIFKRANTQPTDEEIQKYFNSMNDLSNFDYKGLYVFDNIRTSELSVGEVNIFPDYEVYSQIEHFYALVIRDEDSGELSAYERTSATPQPEIKINIADGKELVRKTLKTMLDNIIDDSGRKIKLGKDVEIIKHFTIEPIADNYFMIERVNGSEFQRYWGQLYASYQSKVMLGEMDTDVIRVTFMTMGNSDRRDLVTNILRSRKQFIMQHIKKIGDPNVLDCTISIEGDYFNPIVQGVNPLGVTMVVSILIQNITQKESVEYNSHQVTGVSVK